MLFTCHSPASASPAVSEQRGSGDPPRPFDETVAGDAEAPTSMAAGAAAWSNPVSTRMSAEACSPDVHGASDARDNGPEAPHKLLTAGYGTPTGTEITGE